MTDDFDLRSCIRSIEPNRTVKDKITERLKARGDRKSISVTDLVALRPAYYGRTHPEIELDLDRQQLLMEGTGFHEQFSRAVSAEEYIEQFVEMDGITGRIDIYEEWPVELKTSRASVAVDDLRLRRPSWLEQLGMYCAMTDKTEGRLLVYDRSDPGNLTAFTVRYGGLSEIRSEMGHRRDLLATALESGTPDALPVCPWRGKGCVYEEKGACSCAELDQVPAFPIADHAIEMEGDAGMESELRTRLAQPRRKREGVRIADLVFPRRTFFDSLQPEAPEEKEVPSKLESYDRYGLIRELTSRGLAGKGELKRVQVEDGPIRDRVTTHRDAATVVRVSEFREPVLRWQIPDVFRHYVLRLGFDAALAGKERGRLVVYYRNATNEDAKLMVYDFFFKDLLPLRQEAERRARLLLEAKEKGDPAALPTCPAWMVKYCEYRDRCGCGQGRP